MGALQASPIAVTYLGTASKVCACLRLGWLVLPRISSSRSPAHKALDDAGEPVIEQLVLARLLDAATYDRHLRVTGSAAAGRGATRWAPRSPSTLPGARLKGVAAAYTPYAAGRCPPTRC